MDLLRSLPLGLYLEQPVTWLHRLDSRIKLGWLMTFLLAPILAAPAWRLSLVVVLILLTLTAMIPIRVWKQQMGWLLMVSVFVWFLTAIAPDGLATNHQPRLPADELAFEQLSPTLPTAAPPRPWYRPWGLGQRSSAPNPVPSPAPELPQPTDYRYVLWQEGPFTVTRRSWDLALRVSTLIFTLIYSTNLYLLTTAPEEITTGLEQLLAPLQRFKLPITEIVLTLTLALRFIPLVMEEVQNLVRSVQTRAINWRKIGFKGMSRIGLTIAERLLENLLLRAEQIASAMTVRGFTSPNQHQVQWYQLKFHGMDWLALAVLLVFWSARLLFGGQP